MDFWNGSRLDLKSQLGVFIHNDHDRILHGIESENKAAILSAVAFSK
jgi:hypothetical protein